METALNWKAKAAKQRIKNESKYVQLHSWHCKPCTLSVMSVWNSAIATPLSPSLIGNQCPHSLVQAWHLPALQSRRRSTEWVKNEWDLLRYRYTVIVHLYTQGYPDGWVVALLAESCYIFCTGARKSLFWPKPWKSPELDMETCRHLVQVLGRNSHFPPSTRHAMTSWKSRIVHGFALLFRLRCDEIISNMSILSYIIQYVIYLHTNRCLFCCKLRTHPLDTSWCWPSLGSKHVQSFRGFQVERQADSHC